MSRRRQPSTYIPRQGYIDPITRRFVSRSIATGPAKPLTGIQKAQAARTLVAAIKRGEHQTTEAGILRVYDVALKLGILEREAPPPSAGVVEAWIDLSDRTLHETVA